MADLAECRAQVLAAAGPLDSIGILEGRAQFSHSHLLDLLPYGQPEDFQAARVVEIEPHPVDKEGDEVANFLSEVPYLAERGLDMLREGHVVHVEFDGVAALQLLCHAQGHAAKLVAVLVKLRLCLPALVGGLEHLVVLALGVLDDLCTRQASERHISFDFRS